MAERAAKRPRSARALWQTLGLWIIPTLAFLMGVGLWLTASILRDLADSAYDRSLSGAIRAIDLNISTESGGVGVELPYPLFETFQATAGGEVFFRVSTDDRLVQIGDALLPPPPPLPDGRMIFYDAEYFGRTVRIGAYMRPLDAPLYGASKAQNIIIEVAETTGSREAFLRNVIGRAIWRDVLAVLVAGGLLALGVHMALRPLFALKERLDRREPDDLRQLDGSQLPREVQPLVGAMNRLMQRSRAEAELQRRFIDDASHQLKTPIAVLRTQADYALRATDRDAQRDAVAAMLPVIDRTSRMTAQLLALARARNGAMLAADGVGVDAADLLREVALLHLPPARKRRIMLEVDVSEMPLMTAATEPLLFEAVSNLAANALAASPMGGRVLLAARRAEEQIVIEVTDEGPGMDPEALRIAGERFRLARSGDDSTGLGLSIVLSIIRGQGGTLDLRNRPTGGLAATIRLSSASPSAKNLSD
ncbi:sensor histidine kinase [Gemmobacter serpentinus]|uniref:sensor histidine kinase n=1 Tax=Gemmobacter serpentinus TaxID=2652247 RepID=UPI00124F1826|nr:sensor histidine kinase [Gemmobacter serpentinus]